MNVEGELVALLDAHHVAVLAANGLVDHVDHLLGLAGALLTHDNSNHVNHSLMDVTWEAGPLRYYNFNIRGAGFQPQSYEFFW